ncbi:MAG: hypothetical protein DHS20C12_29710 [Pseudohongiella sp.]|nr:MAG: hypothetical protein DHS20C12_29710 [Pseudohongiella sp.]
MSESKEQSMKSVAEDESEELSTDKPAISETPARAEDPVERGEEAMESSAVAEDDDSSSSDEPMAATAQTTSEPAAEAAQNQGGESSGQQSTSAGNGPSSPPGAGPDEDSASRKPSLWDSVVAYLRKIWPQLRRLLILEIKLCLSILRNMLAMPVAAIAMLLDLIQKEEGITENFDKVIDIGKASEAKINLFSEEEETLQDESSVDAILKRAEDKLKDL